MDISKKKSGTGFTRLAPEQPALPSMTYYLTVRNLGDVYASKEPTKLASTQRCQIKCDMKDVNALAERSFSSHQNDVMVVSTKQTIAATTSLSKQSKNRVKERLQNMFQINITKRKAESLLRYKRMFDSYTTQNTPAYRIHPHIQTSVSYTGPF